MEIESPAFTTEDIKTFMAGYRDHERELLAARLEEVSRRLAILGSRMGSGQTDGKGWNAHEVLAHIAVVSRFYGVLTHRVASGQVSELDLLESVQLRDVAGEQMARLGDAELIRTALADQERTIKTLRASDSNALRRTVLLGGDVTMSAEEIARLALVAHLEMHLDQLEERLA